MSFNDVIKWFNTPFVTATENPPEYINSINPKTLLYMTDANPRVLLADYFINMDNVSLYSRPRSKLAQFVKLLIDARTPKFYPKAKVKDDFINLIRDRFPHLKDSDIQLLLDINDDSLIEMLKTQPTKKTRSKLTIDNFDLYLRYNLDKTCPKCINNQQYVLYDTDVNKFEDVKFLLVGEAPAVEEVKQGKPFVGRAGLLLRDAMQKANIKNWFMFNVVLCFHSAGHPPTAFEIVHCFDNLEMLLQALPDSTIIIPLGKTAITRFGVLDNVTVAMNNNYSYNNFLVLPNIHPSAILRGSMPKDKFIERLCYISRVAEIGNDLAVVKQSTSEEVFNYFKKKAKPPKKRTQPKCTSELGGYDGYMRLNTIYDISSGTVYITAKNKNKKVIVTTDDTYKFWWSNKKHRFVTSIKELNESTISFRNKKSVDLNYTYYKDLPVTTRKSIEFEQVNNTEIYELNIAYFDIEVYTRNRRKRQNLFDMHDIAPINALTVYFSKQKKYITLALSKPIEFTPPFENCEIRFYDTDKDLLNDFFNILSEYDPDVITGWNTSQFDWPYLLKRASYLGVEPHNKYGPIKIINKYNDIFALGVVMVDYLQLYKKLAMIKQDSYKLDYIAKTELSSDMGKVEYEGTLDDLYENNVERFIKYNIQDVNILIELDKKLKLIELGQMMINTSCTTWRDVFSRTVLLDGLIAKYLLDKGMAALDKQQVDENPEFQGAFVKDVTKGIFNWVVDLDLSSLYPYIIARCNLSPDTYYGKTSEAAAQYFVYRTGSEPSEIVVVNKSQQQIFNDFSSFEQFIRSNSLIVLPNGCLFYKHEKELSIFYNIIDKLIQARTELKNKMKKALAENNNQLYQRYDMMQMAYKVLTNALYGGFGAPFFRFYLLDMAESITAVGRMLIKFGSFCAERFINYIIEHKTTDVNFADVGLDMRDMLKDPNELKYILYNDTDSAFVHIEPVLEAIFDNYETQDTDTIVKTVLDVSSKLSEYINNYAVKKLLEMMNNKSDIANKYDFTFKQELVIKRIFFTGVKKRYAIWVINREGVRTDKVKIVGIEIVRTDASRFTRRVLYELIEFILKTPKTTKAKLLQFYSNIKEQFDKLIEEGSIDIAKPVGWNITKNYKAMPRHIRGMLIYQVLFDNAIFELESPRGYEFEIANIVPGRISNFEQKYSTLLEKGLINSKTGIDVIVIPDSETRIDTETFILDYDKHFELNIKNRLKPILTLFGIDLDVDEHQITW